MEEAMDEKMGRPRKRRPILSCRVILCKACPKGMPRQVPETEAAVSNLLQ